MTIKGLKRWIRVNYSKLLYWHSQNFHPDATGIHEKIEKVNVIDIKLFEDWDVFKARTFMLELSWPTIGQAERELVFLSRHLTAKRLIPATWRVPVTHQVSLELFMVNALGNTIDPVAAVRNYKKAAAEFLKLYTSLDEKGQNHDSHHKRILARIEKDTLYLADKLLEYSHA